MNKDIKAINESYEKIRSWWRDRNLQSNGDKVDLWALARRDPSKFVLEIGFIDPTDPANIELGDRRYTGIIRNYVLHRLGKNGEYVESKDIIGSYDEDMIYSFFERENPDAIIWTEMDPATYSDTVFIPPSQYLKELKAKREKSSTM
jgi:hypothetical protein